MINKNMIEIYIKKYKDSICVPGIDLKVNRIQWCFVFLWKLNTLDISWKDLLGYIIYEDISPLYTCSKRNILIKYL